MDEALKWLIDNYDRVDCEEWAEKAYLYLVRLAETENVLRIEDIYQRWEWNIKIAKDKWKRSVRNV